MGLNLSFGRLHEFSRQSAIVVGDCNTILKLPNNLTPASQEFFLYTWVKNDWNQDVGQSSTLKCCAALHSVALWAVKIENKIGNTLIGLNSITSPPSTFSFVFPDSLFIHGFTGFCQVEQNSDLSI